MKNNLIKSMNKKNFKETFNHFNNFNNPFIKLI